jgi:GR25 family glycosyltransferase involved in LPS biosynthesis
VELPEVWMISIKDNAVSQHYKNICRPTWESTGLKVKDFDAVTPEDLRHLTTLDFFGKIRDNGDVIDFTDTEKAVWWSHFTLWYRCVESNMPMIILEHDALRVDDLNIHHLINDKVNFLFLGHILAESDRMKLSPAVAYYITPLVARFLCQAATKKHKWASRGIDDICIYMNVDGWIRHIYTDLWTRTENNNNFLVGDSRRIARQILDEDVGTTIEHIK